MPRVKKIEKARKPQGKCGKCGCEIKAGDSYVKWTFRRSAGKVWIKDRRIRCAKPECYPKQKDLTQSEFWSAIYTVQEQDFTKAEDLSDLESQRDEVVGELENIKDELQGKLDNMPQGLQEGNTGQMLQERIEALDSVCNDMQSVDTSFDEPDKEEEETDEEFEERKDEALKERIQEIAEELQGYLSDISCS